jgi:essential nuclear protein 1
MVQGGWKKKKEEEAPPARKTKRQRAYEQLHAPDEDGDEDDAVLPPELARKVISQAQQQQDEIEGSSRSMKPKRGRQASSPAASAKPTRELDSDGDSDGGDDVDDDGDDDEAELAGAGEYFEDVEEVELGDDEERALDIFMGGGAAPRTLADIIMEKISARNQQLTGDGAAPEAQSDAEAPMPELPPKVIEVYEGVGKLLKTYRSGKLPKAFKIVPRLSNWEEVCPGHSDRPSPPLQLS